MTGRCLSSPPQIPAGGRVHGRRPGCEVSESESAARSDRRLGREPVAEESRAHGERHRTVLAEGQRHGQVRRNGGSSLDYSDDISVRLKWIFSSRLLHKHRQAHVMSMLRSSSTVNFALLSPSSKPDTSDSATVLEAFKFIESAAAEFSDEDEEEDSEGRDKTILDLAAVRR